jgi:hypothetical protein
MHTECGERALPAYDLTGRMGFRISWFSRVIIIQVEAEKKDGSKFWRDAKPSDFVEYPELSDRLTGLLKK